MKYRIIKKWYTSFSGETKPSYHLYKKILGFWIPTGYVSASSEGVENYLKNNSKSEIVKEIVI